MPNLKWLQRFFCLCFVVVSFYSCSKNNRAEDIKNLPQRSNLPANSTQKPDPNYLNKVIGKKNNLPLFWYDNTYSSKQPRNDSTDIIVLYTASHFFSEYNSQGTGKRWHSIRQYLDRAHRMNKKVVLSVKQTNQFLSQKIDPKNPSKTANPSNKEINGVKIDTIDILKDFVRDFGSHPAVIGWYIQDEPTFHSKMHAADGDCQEKSNEDYECETYRHVQGYTKCHAIKNTIRSLTSLPGSKKPLFLAVTMRQGVESPYPRDGSRENILEETAAYQLRDCYDVLMAHLYSIDQKSSRADIEYHLDRTIEIYQTVRKRLTAIGKPFMFTSQTHGTFIYRLPSKREFEYITYAPIATVPDMQAFGYYGRHASEKSLAKLETPETPYVPYKKDGKAWLKEVWDETIDDLDVFRCASKHRVADLNPQVIGNKSRYIQGDPAQYLKGGFYKCLDTNKWYALVVNTDTAKVKNWIGKTIYPNKGISIQIQLPDAGDRARKYDVAKIVNKGYHLPVKEGGKLNMFVEPREVRLISFE